MAKFQRSVSLVCAAVLLGACADAGQQMTGPSETPSLRYDGGHHGEHGVDTVHLGYFSRSEVVAIAQSKGYYADEGLVIDEQRTTSSPTIFAALRDGGRDIILTQLDNLFNYRYNASNPIGGTFDPVAYMASDLGGGSSLVARPEFTTVESLRGQTVAVDSPNSGLAFVLYGIMRAHGLERGVDYNVIVTGGTPFRYADLLAGKFAATILGGGFKFRAEAAGMNIVGGSEEIGYPIMGGAVVARGSWVSEHRDIMERFLRAQLKAQKYVAAPEHREEIIALIMSEDDATDRALAERIYDDLVSADGISRTGALEYQRVYGSAFLRNSFDGFDTPQNLRWLASPASGLYDLSLWRRIRRVH